MWQNLTPNDTVILTAVAAYGSQNDPRFAGLTGAMLAEWLGGPAGTRYGFYFDGSDFSLGLALRFDPAKGRAFIAEAYYDGNIAAEAAFAHMKEKCRQFLKDKEIGALYANRPLDPGLPMAGLFAEVHKSNDLNVTILRSTAEVENLRIEFNDVVI